MFLKIEVTHILHYIYYTNYSNDISAHGKTWTYDPLINSQML